LWGNKPTDFQADCAKFEARSSRTTRSIGRLSSLALLGVCTVFSVSALAGCGAIQAKKLAKKAEEVKKEERGKAIDMFKEAEEADPKNVQIVKELADIFFEDCVKKDVGKCESAATEFGKAAAIDPTNAIFYYQKARAYSMAAMTYRETGSEKANDYLTRSIEAFQATTAKDANFADPYFYIGRASLILDKEKDALDAFTKAIQIDPTFAHSRKDEPGQSQSYVELANLYLNLGFADEGLKVSLAAQKMAASLANTKMEAKKAEETMDDLYNVTILEAKAYEFKTTPKDKLAALEKAAAIPNPSHMYRDVNYDLALAYADDKQPAKACGALSEFLAGAKQAKATEAQSNKKNDAEQKKQKWKCPT
jgi:tetratricopeptide (TPR) repeat protein